MSDRQTQRARLLALLQSHGFSYSPKPRYGWVALPEIMALGIASHTRRIHELRKEWEIELRDEWVGGQRRTAYRLVGKKEACNSAHNGV